LLTDSAFLLYFDQDYSFLNVFTYADVILDGALPVQTPAMVSFYTLLTLEISIGMHRIKIKYSN
jgi:hypothetical protein